MLKLEPMWRWRMVAEQFVVLCIQNMGWWLGWQKIHEKDVSRAVRRTS